MARLDGKAKAWRVSPTGSWLNSRARRETELGAYKHRAQALDATRLTARDQRLVYIAASR